MRYFLKKTVFDAAKKRIEWLFDEFPNVIIDFSGGKDSTLALNMSLMIAKEKKRLPLKVLFIDQETEWNGVIKYIRKVMNSPDIEPIWIQIPIKLFNSTSLNEPFFYCWEEGKQWIRKKETMSIKKNVFKTEKFKNLFKNVTKYYYPCDPCCHIGGTRCEESPARRKALTTFPTYKHITWGKILDKKRNHYIFHPFYDWNYRDVWKAINDHGWDYWKIYDEMYQLGVSSVRMRVSNIHYETSLYSLFYLQELEPDNWNRIVDRIPSINTIGGMREENFTRLKHLPFMFAGWREYRDYLLINLITTPETRELYNAKFIKMDEKYKGMEKIDELYKIQIQVILTNDFNFVKLDSWENAPGITAFLKWKKGGKIPPKEKRYAKYIPI